MIKKIKKLFGMSRTERKYLFNKKFFRDRISSKLLIDLLIEKGVEVGKGTIFHDPATTVVDLQRPWMLHIGAYCKITGNVTILTHDYSRSVLRRRYDDIVGEAGLTFIGDNCFIGMNSIILMGTHIGNNCIVGAGSVVSGSYPDDVVIAGNPAHIIMPLEDFYKKRKGRVVEAAKLYCYEFYKKYGRVPKINEMGPFFPVYLEKNENAIRDNNIWIGWSGDEEEEILSSFLRSESVYATYDSFITDALMNEDKSKE